MTDLVIHVFDTSDFELMEPERIILSDGFRQIITSLRNSWRLVTNCEIKSSNKVETSRCLTIYQLCLEKEIRSVCNRLIQLVEKYILPMTTSIEGQVFFLKTLADYYRYLCEINTMDVNKSRIKSADAYTKALEIAHSSLPCICPLSLSVSLNFSVFQYEIMLDTHEAITISKSAFDQALAYISDTHSNICETNYKSAANILQLLRDNINLWTEHPIYRRKILQKNDYELTDTVISFNELDPACVDIPRYLEEGRFKADKNRMEVNFGKENILSGEASNLKLELNSSEHKNKTVIFSNEEQTQIAVVSHVKFEGDRELLEV